MNRVNVIGAGAWGTALAVHCAGLGLEVCLWARRPEAIGAESPRLPGVLLPPGVRVAGALGPADVSLVAVPMQHLRGVLGALRPGGPLVLCCKGIEAGSLMLPLEVAEAVLPGAAALVLTGPNFAAEVARGLPAAAVLAGGEPGLREAVARGLGRGGLRLYGNADAVGAQIGGATKNVIAVAAGAVTGAGLGENARAGLITRGVAEIARLAVALGGQAETVAGLSGLGDLGADVHGGAEPQFLAGAGAGARGGAGRAGTRGWAGGGGGGDRAGAAGTRGGAGGFADLRGGGGFAGGAGGGCGGVGGAVDEAAGAG